MYTVEAALKVTAYKSKFSYKIAILNPQYAPIEYISISSSSSSVA